MPAPYHGGVSAREIGRRLGVARSTVQDNLKRAAAAGLAWPLADNVTDDALISRPASGVGSSRRRHRASHAGRRPHRARCAGAAVDQQYARTRAHCVLLTFAGTRRKMRNRFRFNNRTVHGGLVTAALPRWAALTGRNAELLAYLQRDEATWAACARALVAHGLPKAERDPTNPDVVLIAGRKKCFSAEVTDVLLGAVAQDRHVCDFEQFAGRREERDGAVRTDVDPLLSRYCHKNSPRRIVRSPGQVEALRSRPHV